MPKMPLPVLPTPGPEPEPRREVKPTTRADLLPVISHAYASCVNPLDRRQFSDLRDLLRAPADHPLPTIRLDGRASHGTRLAITYTAVVHALRLMRQGEVPSTEIDAAVDFARKAAFALDARVVGDPGQGFTLEFPQGRTQA